MPPGIAVLLHRQGVVYSQDDSACALSWSIVIAVFDADNTGTWAYHCEMLYHQKVGMFTTIGYL